MYVTLAAVDEGICQVKNYQTPDPYLYFYAKKALQTETYDFFKHLHSRTGEETGAEQHGRKRCRCWQEGESAWRAAPEPFAIWLGIKKTNNRGKWGPRSMSPNSTGSFA